jgi:GDPmannose 4,6-dehydratase
MKALILGIGGQDGSYLADTLLAEGCEVHGLARRSSVDNLVRIAHIRDKVTIYYGDLLDVPSLHRVIAHVRPDELYNEADQDHVGYSFGTPCYSADTTMRAVGALLEIVQAVDPAIKVFQPLSATMFGDTPPPQDESTPFKPQSPYACAKVGAYHLCRYYRYTHGLHVTTAIMYNHDSPRRGPNYLMHQICRQALAVQRDDREAVVVGSLRMAIDIGRAQDYMTFVPTLLRISPPSDYVMGTGAAYSVGQLAGCALSALGMPADRVREDPSLLRPGPQPQLRANPAKIRALGFNGLTSPKRLIKELLEVYK